MPILHSLTVPLSKVTNREYADFKILNNTRVEQWVRHNGGVDLKICGVGNPFQSNFDATKNT